MQGKKLKNTEPLTFTGVEVNHAPEKRSIPQELGAKNWQQEKVDQFEKLMGISAAKKKAENLVYKTKTFNTEFDKDNKELTELFNSPKYAIVYWNHTWTVSGDFKIFVVYSDNKDYKPPTQPE